MIVNCLLLEEKIEELRILVQTELNTTPYIVDKLIAYLLNGIMHDYSNNYAEQIKYWKELINIIKEQIAEGVTEDET